MSHVKHQQRQRRELYALHRECHRNHFSPDGAWVGPFRRDSVGHAREWLWQAMAFLEGDRADVRLGNAIAAATPHVANHFNPIAAAQLLLHYPDRLTETARRHLLTILEDGLPEAIDFGLAVTGVNNFSSMRAFLFLAASQLVETYRVAYPHKSIPEVYNRFRLRQFGLNLLQLMEDQLARSELAQEFNSPNYSPITLLGVAEIANLIAHEPARLAAARIERRLWRELLAFHHPRLHHTSGPYSRGYTADSVGHASHWKTLCCFLGLDGATTVQKLLFPPQPGLLISDGDLAGQQAILCWLIRPDYHVAEDWLAEFQHRVFPYQFVGSYEWLGMGYRRPDGRVILNVEGDFKDDGGRGQACCYQQDCFSIGSMSRSYTTQNHPCQIVYRLAEKSEPLGSTRSVTVLMLTQRLPEWVTNAIGQKVVPSLLPNNGDFRLEQDQNVIQGTVQPYHWAPYRDAGHGCDEVSFNLFVSEHLPAGRTVESAALDGEEFRDAPLEKEARSASFVIEDGAARVTCSVQAGEHIRFRVCRHGGFLRCAAILYQGLPKMLSRAELAHFCLRFSIQVAKRP